MFCFQQEQMEKSNISEYLHHKVILSLLSTDLVHNIQVKNTCLM